MDVALLLRAAGLGVPVALGALAARMGWLGEQGAAIRALNGYALRVAFPALVCVGLLGGESLLGGAWYEAVVGLGVWPVILCGLLFAVHGLAPERVKGALGLAMVFGNVAYLGLPVIALVFGERALGLASWIVSVHVTLGVTLGAWWAARYGDGARAQRVAWRAVATQPLFWAPFLGASLGAFASRAVQEGVVTLIEPLAKSAAPVALFMLGVYLWQQRAMLSRRPDGELVWYVSVCLVGLPCVMGAAAWGLVQLGWMSVEWARLHVMCAAMPVGITTFSMAYEAGCAPERVAQAIVWSTVCAAITLPCVAWLL